MGDQTLPTDSKKTDPPAPADPAAQPPAKPPAAADPPADPPAPKVVPQPKVDELVGQARLEGKSAERAALLKELGVPDLEAAKAAIKSADDLKKAQMTETERLQKAAADAEKAAADARAAAEKAAADAQAALLKASVISKAAGRFANPEAVYKLADLSKVKPADAGGFDGIEAALDELATKEPWTLTPKDPKTPSLGATNGKGKPAGRTDDDRRAEYFTGGRRKGFFEEGGVVLPKEG